MKGIIFILPLVLFSFINSKEPTGTKKEKEETISKQADILSTLISQIRKDKKIKGTNLEKAVQMEIFNKVNRNFFLSKRDRKKLKSLMDKYNDIIEEVNEKIKAYVRNEIRPKKANKEEKIKLINDVYKQIFAEVRKTIGEGKDTSLSKNDLSPKKQKKSKKEGMGNKNETSLERMIRLSRQIERRPRKTLLDHKPKYFTIIVPAQKKNRGYLRALRSIQLQKFQHVEVIFIVSKKAKSVISILRKEHLKDRTIKRVEVDGNIYEIQSKIKAAKAATGKYIMFLEKEYIFAKNDALINLFIFLKNKNLDMLHFASLEGDFKEEDPYTNKDKFINAEEEITQPKLKKYLSKKFKKAFLGDKIFSREIFEKEPEFDKLKGYDYQDFLNLYSELAQKYMTYPEGVLYELKGNYLLKKKESKKAFKKEDNVNEQLQILNTRKLEELISAAEDAYKKFSKDPSSKEEYNKKIEKLIVKKNIKKLSTIRDKKLIGWLSVFCSDKNHKNGLTAENSKGLEDFCTKVYNVEVILYAL